MARRRWGFAWLVARPGPELLCLPPRNCAAKTRRRAAGMAFTPALTRLLPASRWRAWHTGTWVRRRLSGVGATGGVRAGGRTGRREGFGPRGLSDLNLLGGQAEPAARRQGGRLYDDPAEPRFVRSWTGLGMPSRSCQDGEPSALRL